MFELSPLWRVQRAWPGVASKCQISIEQTRILNGFGEEEYLAKQYPLDYTYKMLRRCYTFILPKSLPPQCFCNLIFSSFVFFHFCYIKPYLSMQDFQFSKISGFASVSDADKVVCVRVRSGKLLHSRTLPLQFQGCCGGLGALSFSFYSNVSTGKVWQKILVVYMHLLHTARSRGAAIIAI